MINQYQLIIYPSTNIIGMKQVILFLFLAIYSLACQPNCNDCSNSFCTACAQGYELTTDTQCLLSQITGCSLYDTQGHCIKCQPTYRFNNFTCERYYDGCLEEDADLSCSLCGFGKKLINSTCVGILHCLEQSGSTCTKCVQNFTLQNGMCVDRSTACMIDDSLTGVCAMCDIGYVLIGYFCINQTLTIPNCYVYNYTGFCLICKSGYVLDRQQQFCVIQGNSICKQFDRDGECLACASNQLKLISGSCIDVRCKVGSPSNCQKCQEGYSIKNGSCYLVDVNCENQILDSLGRCQNCKKGYFVFVNGTCLKLPANCLAANIDSGVCIQCSTGFTLNSKGACNPPIPIPNCLKTNFETNTCSYCKPNYFISGSKCQKVSSLCNGYNSVTGVCINCKNGYINYGGKCVDQNCVKTSGDSCIQCKPNFSPNPLTGLCRFYDPNCLSLSFFSCTQCLPGYYLDPVKCVPLPPNCESIQADYTCSKCKTGWSLINAQCVVLVNNCKIYSYDNSLSICRQCTQGYELKDSQCIFGSKVVQTVKRDPNCINFQDDVCVECANRYYFFKFTCVPINPNCKDYRVDGKCTSCYGGYVISNGSCILNVQDKHCKDFANGSCSSCYAGYFLNSTTKICTQVSSLCKTSNTTTGSCLQCFVGYTLVKGACLSYSRDPNCINFNSNGICLNCSLRFYLKDGICTPVNTLCKTYNITLGNCLSCYPGYYLSKLTCLIGIDPKSDVNCEFRDTSGNCTKCYANYFLAANLSCLLANPLCKSVNFTNGACLSCYTGYILNGSNCIIANSNNSDANCFRFASNRICSQCYAGFFIKEGVCTKINTLCKTYNLTTGWCLSCYPGYELSENGLCVIPMSSSLSPKDPYCLQRSGSNCLKCSTGYFPSSSGFCQATNPLCKTVDFSNGYCTSCYQGYTIQGADCVVLQDITFPFCQIVRNGICTRCIEGYYTQTPYQCSAVSILCRGYDQNTGNCLSCIPGYFLQGGECVYPASGFDQNCITYDVSAFCSSCKPGYYLLNYLCARIDPFCVNFDHGSQTCMECGGGKSVDGSRCK